MTQRDIMRQLVERIGPDREAVCREYAKAERLGKVQRKNDTNKQSPEQYADALWIDGVRKGWLVPAGGSDVDQTPTSGTTGTPGIADDLWARIEEAASSSDGTSKLTSDQREQARLVLAQTRTGIEAAAGGDSRLRHSIRRYIRNRLEYDERGTPMERRKIKDLKFDQQKGLCGICGKSLDQAKDNHLHREDAALGYTVENTTLVHPTCHRAQQEASNFT